MSVSIQPQFQRRCWLYQSIQIHTCLINACLINLDFTPVKILPPAARQAHAQAQRRTRQSFSTLMPSLHSLKPLIVSTTVCFDDDKALKTESKRKLTFQFSCRNWFVVRVVNWFTQVSTPDEHLTLVGRTNGWDCPQAQ